MCSLLENQKKLSISLFFEVTEEGLVLYDDYTYELSTIKNVKRYSYNEVDDLIKAQPQNDLSKLNAIMAKRRDFRRKQSIVEDDKSPSEAMIEELMLIAHTFFTHFKEKTFNEVMMKLK